MISSLSEGLLELELVGLVEPSVMNEVEALV